MDGNGLLGAYCFCAQKIQLTLQQLRYSVRTLVRLCVFSIGVARSFPVCVSYARFLDLDVVGQALATADLLPKDGSSGLPSDCVRLVVALRPTAYTWHVLCVGRGQR